MIIGGRDRLFLFPIKGEREKMNKPNRHEDAMLWTVKQTMERTNWSRRMCETVAKEAGAYIKAGRTARIIGSKFMDHIEKMAEAEKK